MRRGGCPWLDALWLEELVWHDIRGFVENPGEVLERVKEQMEERRTQTGELEERIASLTKRLATVQGEKDKYVKLYAAGHLDEEELEVHLLDVKNRISNLMMLIESAGADLAREEQDAAAANSTASGLRPYAATWRRSKRIQTRRGTVVANWSSSSLRGSQ